MQPRKFITLRSVQARLAETIGAGLSAGLSAVFADDRLTTGVQSHRINIVLIAALALGHDGLARAGVN